jgi:PPE-repeat protein
MTVPPPEISANRAQLTSLIARNLLGQNTPAVAANEVAYGEMWAQDVAAMYSYAGDSQAASQVTPFTPPEQTTNEGGLGAQSAATAQAAGTSAGNAQTTLTSAGSMMSAVPNALQTLTSSSAGVSAFSDFSNPFDLASLGSSLLGNGVGLIGLSGAAGFITDAEHKVDGVCAAPRPRPTEPEAPTPRLPEKATTASAGLGRASSLGGLSVPEGWATAAPQVRLVGPRVAEHQSRPGERFKSRSIQRNAIFWRGATDGLARTRHIRFARPPSGRQKRGVWLSDACGSGSVRPRGQLTQCLGRSGNRSRCRATRNYRIAKQTGSPP